MLPRHEVHVEGGGDRRGAVGEAGAHKIERDDAADGDEGDDDEYDWGGWWTAMMMVRCR